MSQAAPCTLNPVLCTLYPVPCNTLPACLPVTAAADPPLPEEPTAAAGGVGGAEGGLAMDAMSSEVAVSLAAQLANSNETAMMLANMLANMPQVGGCM